LMTGQVTADGQPRVFLEVDEREWPALIDTGFNGDLELPYAVGPTLQARRIGTVYSLLADGRQVVEDNYQVQFPFDGQVVSAEATFAAVSEILIGTRLLRNHRLEINFRRRTVLIEREP
jgi:predicted aspartyl protease